MTDIQKLLDIMAALRAPETGCPWDLEQDFRSIAPYTIEEAYEVAAAIDEGDLAALQEELGDLLLQVAFHARLAEEQKAFKFADVVTGICAKLIRRHPHVFGDLRVASATAQRAAWENYKAQEQGRNSGGQERTLSGVSRALPALARAAKLGRRAAAAGFDWPDAAGVFEKVREEEQELIAAHASGSATATVEEVGDLLFAVANLARHLDVDPEEALRRANGKFEQRFGWLEDHVRSTGRTWEQFTPAELDGLWQEVKRSAG